MTDQQPIDRPEEGQFTELAGVIITNLEGRILLLHRIASDKTGIARYEIPGGGLEEGETIEEAARREALEELGLTVRTGPVLGSATFIENGITFRYSWFEASIIEGVPEIPENEKEKFDGFDFYSIEEIDGMRDQISPNTINFLDAYKRGEITLSDEITA
jgi:8-oxo-dGTP pyrophosphatase MutT (NUDIX family)